MVAKLGQAILSMGLEHGSNRCKNYYLSPLKSSHILTIYSDRDSFFHAADGVSEDFLPECANQQQAEREEFERVAGLRMENWVEQ